MKERQIVPAFDDKDWFRLCSHIEFPPDDRIELDCWICDLNCSNGYPKFGICKNAKPKNYYAMRVMLAWMFGDQPDRTAGHKKHEICGSRRCVSPYHLEWQTWEEQSLQQKLDGTFSPPPHHIGINNNNSKLTEKQVIELRKKFEDSGISIYQLAKIYQIASSTCQDIINKKTWKHI